MKKTVILLLLLNFYNTSFSQNQEKIDSLEKLLLVYDELKIEKKNKNSIILELFKEYKTKSYDKAMIYFRRGIERAKRNNNIKNIIEWHNAAAALHTLYKKYDLSLQSYSKSIKIYEENKNTLPHYVPGWVLIEIGNVFYILEDYDKAADIFEEAVVDFKKHDILTGISLAKSNLAIIFNTRNEHKKALRYCKESLELRRTAGTNFHIAYAYAELGITYNYLNKKDSSRSAFEKMYKIMRNSTNKNNIAYLEFKHAFALINQNRTDSAISVLKKAITISDKNQKKEALYAFYQLLAKAYGMKEKYGKAIQSINKSFSIDSLKVLSIYASRPYIEASGYYAKLGDYKNALEMYRRHTYLFSKTFNNKVWDNSYRFEKNRQSSETGTLLKNIELKEKEHEMLRLQITAGIILIIFMALVIFLISKKNRMSKRLTNLLEERNKMINERNYQLTLKNKKISDQNIELNFKQAQIKRLLKKYQNKPDTNKETEAFELEDENLTRTTFFEKFSIENQINEVIILFGKKAEHIKITGEFEENLPEYYCNNQEMISVWSNLLENSIKATKQSGEIKIAVSSKNNTLKVRFKDNGFGIKKSELKNIFKPFISFFDSPSSRGLGLYIAKKIIEKHAGSISVNSVVNEFTEFTVILPVSNTK